MKLENIKRICSKCGAKCCYLDGPAVTKAERRRILKAGFGDAFAPAGKYYYVKHKNGKCPFLKNNLCRVQDVKPLMCKIWPVYPVFKGKERRFMVFDCPLTPHLSKADMRGLKLQSQRLPKDIVIDAITNLTPATTKRLNRFNWEKRYKEALK
jgi:Fe-S-cluster containining protein